MLGQKDLVMRVGKLNAKTNMSTAARRSVRPRPGPSREARPVTKSRPAGRAASRSPSSERSSDSHRTSCGSAIDEPDAAGAGAAPLLAMYTRLWCIQQLLQAKVFTAAAALVSPALGNANQYAGDFGLAATAASASATLSPLETLLRCDTGPQRGSVDVTHFVCASG
jgi:hypothetical protein